MTIDEAIKERQKVIEVQEKLYEDASTNESKEIIKSAIDNDRQLVEWLVELKDLREENKVLTSECDRLIKEKGELNKLKEKAVLDICRREARLRDAKRLLGEALRTLNDGSCNKDCRQCKWNNNGCDYGCRFAWKYGDEVSALIGETNVDQ